MSVEGKKKQYKVYVCFITLKMVNTHSLEMHIDLKGPPPCS